MVDLIGRLSNPWPLREELTIENLSPADSPPERRATTHQPQRRLTAAEVAELVESRWSGETVEGLAERFGIHRTTVMTHLRRNGVPGRPRSKKWNEQTLQLEAARYRTGESLADIASRYSISPSTVGRRLLSAGVRLRPRPGMA